MKPINSTLTFLPKPITPYPLLDSLFPLLPIIFSSNVLSISWEWTNHLAPLTTLSTPIAPRTLSEIFKRSYINGAYSFLFSLLGSIFTSAYLAYSIWDIENDTWTIRRGLWILTGVFGVLHLFPFSAIIVRYVIKAADGSGTVKDEEEVKRALKSWLRVNRWRMWTDGLAMCCAVAAVIVS